MISIEEQQNLLVAISNKLDEKITAYAIGGTAMMFQGFKEATLDIDLVFTSKKAREVFKKAIASLGYEKINAGIVYGDRKNKPEMFSLGNERFDLFLTEVISFSFSKNMQKRAVETHKFGEKLILKIADANDLILMKCATDRMKDLDDARRIINNKQINWETILNEAIYQAENGKPMAVIELGYFAEKLEKQGIKIPKSIKNKMWKYAEKQIKNKTRN